MAPYGDLKVNNLIYETGSGDVTVAASTIPSTAGATFTGDVTLTGGSYNVVWDKSDNALEFADNAKAIFGTGSDLQIYFDGSNGYIKEAAATAGQFLIDGWNGTDIRQGSTGDYLIRAICGSSV